jgi:lactose/L-arabinose transport system ATP-binding protein
MIYVTHDQTEAMTLADQIVVMRLGKVEQAGSPEELYQNPANLFVAGFIGSPRMNFLRGTVAGGGIALDAGPRLGGGIGSTAGEVQIGIRPEHFHIGSDGAALDFTVDVVENLGGTRYLYGTAKSGESLVVEARDQPGIKAGAVVPLAFRSEQVMYFSPTGDRLRPVN